MKRKGAYVYFVSFVYETSFGNTEVSLSREIQSLKDIRAVELMIQNKLGFDVVKIIILNYQLLRIE